MVFLAEVSPLPEPQPKAARAAAAAQAAAVMAGVWAVVAGLGRAGLGADTKALPPALGVVAHVAVLATTSLGLAWLALGREPSRPRALGVDLGSIRGRLPLVVMYGMAGAVVTYAVQAAVTLAYVQATGGIERHVGLARERSAAFSTFATVPLWVMLPVAVVAGFYEDVVFRGFLLGRLRIVLATRARWMGDALAVAASAAVFGLGHAYQGWLGVVQTGLAGACLGALAVLAGSVWPAIVAHVGIDAVSLVALHVLRPAIEKALRDLPVSP